MPYVATETALQEDTVRVELLPHVGVADFRIGMPFDEAVRLGRRWGEVKVSGPTVQVETVKVPVLHRDFDLTLLFDDGETLGSIEVWRFHDEDADIQVTLEGIDVFRIPSDDLGDLLRARGHHVEEEDLFVVRDLDMIFGNESSFEYPTDDEGFPLYFDYILLTTDTGYV